MTGGRAGGALVRVLAVRVLAVLNDPGVILRASAASARPLIDGSIA
jgi:hypothetical protein